MAGVVLVADTAAERRTKKCHLGGFHGRAWLGGAESDPVITYQIERL